MALLALKDLVENQLPCLAGAESGVFDLLFRLREDLPRSVRRLSLARAALRSLVSASS